MTMRVIVLALLVLASGSLQGCAPVIAAGVGTTGVLMAQDRRTNQAFLDDQKIEASAFELIDKQIKSVMHVNVTSFNHNVLISGEVPDAPVKDEIGKIVSGIEKVHNVSNELAISPTSSLVSRSNDSLITSDVKLRFLNNGHFNGEHIKVVTENSTVFLMGIVSHAEADAATEITRTTRGVRQVVRMFEYLD
jgi:osmotically-inducible protein OsmY